MIQTLFRAYFIGVLFFYQPCFSQQRYAIVISEFFPDPTPSMGLPPYEFVELRNVSNDTIALKGWKISDGTSTATITASMRLPPDSMVVLCPTAAVSAYSSFGKTLGVTGFPSLNNDADLLMVIAPEGRFIHGVSYDLSWYQDGVKQEGGWSIEMVDPRNPCGGKANYTVSRADRGGTPGRENSVAGHRLDASAPLLLQAVAEDALHLRLHFSEPVDSFSLVGAVVLKESNVASYRSSDPLWQDWHYVLKDSLQEGRIYVLQVAGVQDCVGNRLQAVSFSIALPQMPRKGDVVINELLFDPPTNGYDYVEIWNKGNRVLDLSKLLLARWDDAGGVVQATPLASATTLLFPATYAVLTTEPDWLQAHYSAVPATAVLPMASMPSMPDDAGSVLLCLQDGTVLDAVPYDADWHLPVLYQREGVALERIDGNADSKDPDNWTSAAATVGWGTPGTRNSQHRELWGGVSHEGPDPKIFSPNLDGLEDITLIKVQTNQPGMLVTIKIYDQQGRLVRLLLNNRSVPVGRTAFPWNGLDDQQRLLGSGIYIISVQQVSLRGTVKQLKYAVAINRS